MSRSSTGLRDAAARLVLAGLLLFDVGPVLRVCATDESLDMYCGTTWVDAFENCNQACPGGSDSECDAGESCHGYTGCAAKNGASNNDVDVSNGEEGDDPYGNNMCGSSWLTAMLTCNSPCPPGTDCPNGQTCYAATNCDKPMEPIVSRMIMSLLGEYEGDVPSMDSGETGVFSESVLAFLAEKMEENKVSINGADVTGQSFSKGGGRRGLKWKDELTGASAKVEVGEGRLRRLPTGSSALDVSMTITGEYRPPPYQDMDLLIEDSINRASANVVKDLRERGRRGGTEFFERVDDLAATRVAAATKRPTQTPTEKPSTKPTAKPTTSPTDLPTEQPTTEPSASPTRSWEQMLQTGHGADLYEGTAQSFGNLFQVKTKADAETVLVKGLDFYCAADSRVEYEVWTKEGTWVGFESKIESFTKIAEGQVRSRGACDEATADNCEFVRIPFKKFANVAIRGGGETRSFYITLKTKDIVYKRGDPSSDGFKVQVENPDIEVYEGAGVLIYPFSQATEAFYFRQPRGFLGRIWYERNPCEDGGNEWPCQTRSPVTQLQLSSSKPTKEPTPKPSMAPTSIPTPKPGKPSASSLAGEPTASGLADKPSASGLAWEPSASGLAGKPSASGLSSSTLEPTRAKSAEMAMAPTIPPSPKPIIEYSYDEADVTTTNIAVTLHNVEKRTMDDREKSKYSEVLMEYLRSHSSLQGASVNVIEVTIWHQAIVDGSDKFRGKGKRPANDSRGLQDENSSSVLEVGLASGTTANDTTAGDAETPGSLPSAALLEQNEVGEESFAGPVMKDAEDEESLPPDSPLESVEITTIIKTVNSVLPSEVTNVLLLHVIDEENADLMDRFKKESFYSYFLEINDISGKLIDEITSAPSPFPTTQAQMLAANVDVSSENGDVDHEEERTNIITVVGVIIGLLWCILTLCSLCYLAKARVEMKNERLLRNERSNKQNEEYGGKVKKETSRFSVFENLVDADNMDHSGDTMKLMDDDVSHASGGYTGLYDVEEGGGRDPTVTISDLFPGDPANGGDGPRVGRRSSFDERLQAKMSGAHPPSQIEAANNQAQEKASRRRSSTFNERLQAKMCGALPGIEEEADEAEAPPMMATRPRRSSFDERLQQKLGEADSNDPKREHLQDAQDELDENKTQEQAPTRKRRDTCRGSYAERLQRKLSLEASDGGAENTPKTARQKRHTVADLSSLADEGGGKDREGGDPLQMLFGSVDGSKQDTATDLKASKMNRRRSDGDGTSDASLPKPRKNRRASTDDRKSVVRRSSRSLESNADLDSTEESGRSSSSNDDGQRSESRKKKKEKDRRSSDFSRQSSNTSVRSQARRETQEKSLSKGQKSRSSVRSQESFARRAKLEKMSSTRSNNKANREKKPSRKDHNRSSSDEKDMGTNMVEMLFT